MQVPLAGLYEAMQGRGLLGERRGYLWLESTTPYSATLRLSAL